LIRPLSCHGFDPCACRAAHQPRSKNLARRRSTESGSLPNRPAGRPLGRFRFREAPRARLKILRGETGCDRRHPPYSVVLTPVTRGLDRWRSQTRQSIAGRSRRYDPLNRLSHPGKFHPTGSPDARAPPRASPAGALEQSCALERLQVFLSRSRRLLLLLLVDRFTQDLNSALVSEQADVLVLDSQFAPHLRREQNPPLTGHF